MVQRLISANRSQIKAMSAQELKESIWKSEGRVVMAQNAVMIPPVCYGCSTPELSQALGADMIMFNTYSLDPNAVHPGLSGGTVFRSEKGNRIKDMEPYVDIPMGVYLECGSGKDISNNFNADYMKYRCPSRENLEALKAEGVKFVVLAGNPGTGVTYESVLEAVKLAKEIVGDEMLIFAGKWEDGAGDYPVIGDPIKDIDFYKDLIKQLIDAGTDCICLPMPGSRWGITVEIISELVAFIHRYKKGTLALTFLDGSIEGSDEETVRQCAILSKQTGADIHTSGDAGIGGMTIPEDLLAFSIAIKGKQKTWQRMAASRR